MEQSARRPGLLDLFGVLVLGTVALRSGGMAGDPGIAWHVRAGEAMLSGGQLLQIDPRSMTESPWVNTQWLADLLFAALVRIGGWPLLEVFAIGIILLAVHGVCTRAMVRWEVPGYAVLLLIGYLYLLVGVQWFLRPVLFSFLLFALLSVQLYELTRSADRRVLLLFPPLFLLWANLHPGFAIGLLLIGVYIGAFLLERKTASARDLGVSLLACSVITICNPHGLDLHRNILALVGSRYFMNLNSEWLSPNFNTYLFVPFLLVISLLPFAMDRRRSFLSWLLVLVFGGAALSSRRYIPFFGLAMFPVVSGWFPATPFPGTLSGRLLAIVSRWCRGTRALLSGIVFTGLAMFVFARGALPLRVPTDSGPEVHFPKDAAAALRALVEEDTPIFISPDLGGYFSYRSRGRYFIDDRNELHGVERYEQFRQMALALPGWEEVAKQFDILIIGAADPLRSAIGKEWELIYTDEAVVIVRRAKA